MTWRCAENQYRGLSARSRASPGGEPRDPSATSDARCFFVLVSDAASPWRATFEGQSWETKRSIRWLLLIKGGERDGEEEEDGSFFFFSLPPSSPPPFPFSPSPFSLFSFFFSSSSEQHGPTLRLPSLQQSTSRTW